jgi:hypothetical protein
MTGNRDITNYPFRAGSRSLLSWVVPAIAGFRGADVMILLSPSGTFFR